MISTTYAFQGLEVKGQGSILASPALYKDEQNGAPSQSVEPSVWGGSVERELAVLVGQLSCGGSRRVEGECQSVERAPK